MVKLVDKPDLGAADARALGVGKRRGRGTIDIDFAGVRMFEQTGDVKKCRLADTGRRNQRHRLPRPHRELGAFEDFQRRGALMVAALDRVQEYRRLFVLRTRPTHTAAPRPDRAAPRAMRDRASRAARASAPSRLPRWSRWHP